MDERQHQHFPGTDIRPQLEWQIRRRTTALPNVQIVQRDVNAPRFDGERQAVTGVLLATAGDDEFVPADLVVDASGRGARLPAWLDQWGFAKPIEQTVDVGIGYATQQLRIPDGLIAEKVVVAGVSRTQPAGLGMLRLGLVPSGDDALRLFTWYLMTVVYVGFWLALSMLCSVLFKNSGTAFFAVLAVWLIVTFFGSCI